MGKMTEPSLANRRRSQRRKPRNSVKVECRKGSSGLGANLAKTLLDVSDSGVRLVVPQALDLQSEVEIIIGGYGMKAPIKRLGTVRWLLKLEGGLYCAGIEFQKHIDYREWQNLASPS
jgi:hypothetical protein